MYRFEVYLFILSVVYAKSLPEDTPSGYAKVSNFGVKTSSGANEARSSGLSLYSQSSNAKISSGQNLRSKITYFNPSSSRVGEDHNEDLPGKGEVQERYNPRPYFQYLNVPSSSNDPKPEQKPAVVYGSPFKPAASPPVPTNLDSPQPDSIPDSNPNSDLDSNPIYNSGPPSPGNSPSIYDSPYDSYNPSKPTNSDDSDSQKPPGNLYESPYDSYNPKPDDKPETQYLPANNPPPPPSMPPSPTKNEYPGYPYAPQELDHPPKDSDMYHPPQKPMEVDSYMPQDEKPSHDFSGYSDQGPQIVATVKPPESVHGHYQEYSPPSTSFDHHHEHIVDSPPTSYNYPAKIPEYVDHDPKGHHFQYHDHDYHDHHVYHEVTTTTEMPEERVNKGHYSYYYLGRKLWYIPLYFSAYFILYITVLILKSIARHKVNFIHDLHDLGKGRSGRDMKIDEITHNVTNAINNATQKYM
ncbi:uncharacterized protein [Onthophagus taurus]|uniref:uncharacterized protein n=1 Tax=Onthophagus taurus TaxID=166361 RepID=UPI0039BDC392